MLTLFLSRLNYFSKRSENMNEVFFWRQMEVKEIQNKMKMILHQKKYKKYIIIDTQFVSILTKGLRSGIVWIMELLKILILKRYQMILDKTVKKSNVVFQKRK